MRGRALTRKERLALVVARDLRKLELSYAAISKVLSYYEGVELPPRTIRDQCRKRGAPPKPHGRPLCGTNWKHDG